MAGSIGEIDGCRQGLEQIAGRDPAAAQHIPQRLMIDGAYDHHWHCPRVLVSAASLVCGSRTGELDHFAYRCCRIAQVCGFGILHAPA